MAEPIEHVEESPTEFYIGAECDPKTLERSERTTFYASRHLTTHGVVVGMTGSGKTGLCLTLLEEAAIDQIPAILIDPKGDMANLLLTFPELRGADFLPWQDPEEAKRKKQTPEEYADATAARWKKGLADWKQDGKRIRLLKESAEFRVYTPGSEAGLPISIVQNFAAPSAEMSAEDRRSKVNATISALLGLAGVNADPVRSREHILLSNILLHCWDQGEDVPLSKLIGYIQEPPIRNMGVFDIDDFYPPKDRAGLALSINNILAAPSFQSWMTGEPLELDNLLYSPERKPRHLIFSIAHLSDEQRMFFTTLLLEQVIGWMRAQSGTSSLRLLLYFDEVFGYLPPHPGNPPSKEPLLTLLKQARAFGVGVLLATQNPVDLDYKALSNAGTWFVGKLQTERDKARLLDGLESVVSAQGTLSDRSTLDKMISSLRTQVFLYHNVHLGKPSLLHTRWALSYLAGPLSREKIRMLTQPHKSATKSRKQAAESTSPTVANEALKTELKRGNLETTADAQTAGGTAPLKVEGVTVVYLPLTKPAKVFLAEIGAKADASGAVRIVYQPRMLAEGQARFVDRKKGIEQKQDYRVLFDVPEKGDIVDWSAAENVAGFELLEEPPVAEAAWNGVPEDWLEEKTLRAQSRQFEQFLYDSAGMSLLTNPTLNVSSEPGEDSGAFGKRCQAEALARRDAEANKSRPRFEKRLQEINDRLGNAQRKVDAKQAELDELQRSQVFSIGETAFRFLLGKKAVRSASKSLTRADRAQSARRELEGAQREVWDLEEKRRQLEQEWADFAGDLNDKWLAAADAVEETRLTPRKSDVSTTQIALAFVPFWESLPPAPATGLAPAYR